jgi:hypothetical protein
LLSTLPTSLNRQPAFVWSTCKQCGTLPVLHRLTPDTWNVQVLAHSFHMRFDF